MTKHGVGLTQGEREELLARASRGSGRAAGTRRANLLLAVDQGGFADLRTADKEAAMACRSTARTVHDLRRRLVEEGFDGVLARKARRGPGNARTGGEAEARIVAPARADPPEGHARRALRPVAERSVELGCVESISHVAVGSMPRKTSFAHGHARNGASRSTPGSSWRRRGTCRGPASALATRATRPPAQASRAAGSSPTRARRCPPDRGRPRDGITGTCATGSPTCSWRSRRRSASGMRA
mgnify:CR=1 FL=1